MKLFRCASLFVLALVLLLLTAMDSQAGWRRGRCRSGCSTGSGGAAGFYAPAPAVVGCQPCGVSGCSVGACTAGCPNGMCVPQSFRPFVPNYLPAVMPSSFGCPGGVCPIPR